MSFLRIAVRALGPDRGLLAAAVTIAAVSAGIQTLLLLTLATLALALGSDAGPAGTPWLHGVPVSLQLQCWIALALTLAALAIAWPLAWIQARIGARAVEAARARLVHGFLAATHAYRGTHREGYFQQLVGEYGQHLSLLVTHLGTLAVTGVTMAVLLIAPMLVHPALAPVALVGMAGSLAVLLLWTRLPRRDPARISRVLSDLASATAETVRIADDLEAYRVGAAVERKLAERIRAASVAQRRIAFHDFVVPNAYQYGALAVLLAIVALSVRFLPGSHASLALLTLLMIRLIGYGRQALGAIQQGTALLPHAEMVELEMRRLAANAAPGGGRGADRFAGLDLRDVDFAYPEAPTLLAGLTLRVAPGEAVGVAGASGGGKSSLCMLAMGLLRPSKGVVAIGGTDLADLSPESWRRLAAYVPQDCRMILGSVADNIRFLRDDVADADIVEAAKAAHLHDEIIALPQGYETVVGPSSRDLSGGQRQRLVLARALAGRPGLLVLDEPSSALDPRSEGLIVETLRALKGSTALLVIAHRPATLSFCDRVLLLEQGALTLVEDRRERPVTPPGEQQP